MGNREIDNQEMQDSCDRDLNSEVALRVMEWTVDGDPLYPSWNDKDGTYRGHFNDWQPATDPAQMMIVIDEMINRHDAARFRIDTLIPNSDSMVFYADFGNEEDTGTEISDYSLARAVCRAAIEYVNKQNRMKARYGK